MSTPRPASAISCFVLVLACAQASLGQERTVVINGGGGGVQVMPGGGWGYGGGQGMQFEQFMMTLTQLNMTPDFTLDKDAKQKLLDVREEWKKAQAKFFEDNKEAIQKLQQQMMEAYKAKDQDDVKLANQKLQELYASGPKGEEYMGKAKAALSAEQLKAVEDKLAKAEAERKAMMEKWRQGGGRANPGMPLNEKK